MHRYASPFMLGDRVSIDGDNSIIGTVVAVMFGYAEGHKAYVAWMSNGGSCRDWIEDTRLSVVK